MTSGGRLAVAGLVAGAGVVGVVAVLLHHTARPTTEIGNYVDEILIAAGGIERNVSAAPQLAATRDLVASLRAPGGTE